MDIVLTVVLGFGIVFLMMLMLWVIHLKLQNAGVVDVGWGIGFILLTSVYILRGEGLNLKNVLALFMVTFWGLRLSLHLIQRLRRDNKEDERYRSLRAQWQNGQNLKFFFFFEFQAFLQVILSIPFLIISLNNRPGLSSLEIFGFLIWVVAVTGEAIADKQLAQFKSNSQNKGKVCQAGLWHYSRHPNYFFECLVWIGYCVFAMGSPSGWISVISPIMMMYLFLKVSGVPLAEAQSLKSRGDQYREYQRSTSVLIPWFKK